MKKFFWLYPGIRIKRWIILIFFGALIFGFGFYLIFIRGFFLLGIGFIVLAGITVIYGVYFLLKYFIRVVAPYENRKSVEVAFKDYYLKKKTRIVAIGGGTGLSSLLNGIKEYTGNVSAVVTVMDDGGSSGRLRREFNILPPGDIRNCLVALAKKQPLMQRLFQYRFKEKGDSASIKDENLTGHTFGNLFITAMTNITGSFQQGVSEASKVLAIAGKVIPSTLENAVLCVELQDGNIVEGETNISKSSTPIKNVFLKPSDIQPNPESIEEISRAEVIILGPGSLYTSIIPNLLIRGIKEEINKSSALKIYVCNIMTQPGETDGYSASKHLNEVERYLGSNVDYIIVNVESIPEPLLERYRQQNAFSVVVDEENLLRTNVKIVKAELVSKSDYARHNPVKLAQTIMNLIGNKK